MAGSDAERLFQRLVENIPGVVAYLDLFQVDDPGRSVPIYISPQIEDLLGYPVDAWLTEDELWLDVLHPDDRSRMVEADERARRTLSSLFAEYRMIARDGHVVWVSENAAVVKDEVSGAVYWQGVMVDVTERKAAETYRERAHTMLRRKNALLRESDRLKDELISVVSHDLRTPLTSIMGYLELVLDEAEGPLTPEQRGFLEVIERNADRLLALVNDLLLISRAQAGKLELDLAEVDLGEIAAEVVEAQRPKADEFGLDLRLVCEAVCATVDRARIAELLENLVFERPQVHAGRRIGRGARESTRRIGGPRGCGHRRRDPGRRSGPPVRALLPQPRGAERAGRRSRPLDRQGHRRRPRRPDRGHEPLPGGDDLPRRAAARRCRPAGTRRRRRGALGRASLSLRLRSG